MSADDLKGSTGSASLPQASRRLWRMRRLHHFVDAELSATEEGAIELTYAYNGELTYRRTWPSREQALAEASAKRAQLERDGWMFHW
jgi:hypothetical protein